MKEVKDINPDTVKQSLNSAGYAHVSGMLSVDECNMIAGLYDDEKLFRSTISMQRYRFGLGEYKYFGYPLPPLIQSVRESLYGVLAPIANEWMQKSASDIHYPIQHKEFISVCHAHGQVRPTPLILRDEVGGYNTLHQDLYGDVYFPFQVVFMLKQKGKDYQGGELVFVEQLPRAQSKASVLSPEQGDAVIFTTNFRPVQGTRGFYRAKMKHGVSAVTKGVRYTMGVIFHDAK
jgi:hypothetical protein